ncbi:hypothetical protein FRUB_09169 [Fimbriiglobus ruber]|uniref:HEAT repeat domain-containing protein n=2 Tax=Fimbriiglobus ruber TaxID=1908690 RepID=A0A225DGV2_9BACT|nr:hypothetical protein FRUB_09169 [Fimbriiglobus ruber]
MPASGLPSMKEPEWPSTFQGRGMSEWLADLSSPDPSTREKAVRIIPVFSPESRKIAIKPLIARIKGDTDPSVRANAILALGYIQLEQKEDIHAAAVALQDILVRTVPGSVHRLYAAKTLSRFGSEGHAALQSLYGIIDDPAWETRQAAAAAIGRVGAPLIDEKAPPGAPPKRPASQLAMAKLVHMLKDTSNIVRMEAATSLLLIGPPFVVEKGDNPNALTEYEKAVQPLLDGPGGLIARLKVEKDPTVKVWIMMVSISYDDRLIDETITKIAAYAGAPEAATRIQALMALGLLGPRAKAALPQIRDSLQQKEPVVVANAISCLTLLGDEAKPAIPDLEKLKAETKIDPLKELASKAIDSIRTAKKVVDPAPAAPPAPKNGPAKRP